MHDLADRVGEVRRGQAVHRNFRDRILTLQRLASRLEVDILGEATNLTRAFLTGVDPRAVVGRARRVGEINDQPDGGEWQAEYREEGGIPLLAKQPIHFPSALPEYEPGADVVEQRSHNR